jgi:hypothetical protein
LTCPNGNGKLAEVENQLKRHSKATQEALGMAIENEFDTRELEIGERLRHLM